MRFTVRIENESGGHDETVEAAHSADAIHQVLIRCYLREGLERGAAITVHVTEGD